MDAITIRRAGPDDLETVLAGRLRFLGELRDRAVDRLEPEFVETTRDFLVHTHTRTFHTWLAEHDATCVGLVSVVLWDAPPRPEEHRALDGYVVNMHVAPGHRRRGLGRRLLDRCLDEARAMGVRRFVLHTTDDGRHLYESSGFAPEAGWLHRYG